ncbi:MAG: hypothetical protein WA447_15775 [Candidatus Binatus sp.]
MSLSTVRSEGNESERFGENDHVWTIGELIIAALEQTDAPP